MCDFKKLASFRWQSITWIIKVSWLRNQKYLCTNNLINLSHFVFCYCIFKMEIHILVSFKASAVHIPAHIQAFSIHYILNNLQGYIKVLPCDKLK